MAVLFKPYKMTSTDMENLAISEGQFIICTDTGRMYLDINSTTRLPVGGTDVQTGVIPENPEDTTDLNIWIETE